MPFWSEMLQKQKRFVNSTASTRRCLNLKMNLIRDLLPGVQPQGLKGGVKYWDGQFDDARLALALARTAALHGALLLNYCEAVDVLHDIFTGKNKNPAKYIPLPYHLVTDKNYSDPKSIDAIRQYIADYKG